MKTIAIIPARGGSKGIPNKNLRSLAGKPLLVHTIEHAQLARTVDKIVVSTDDSEITEIALAAGAEVVKRPEAISGDTASSESAIAHVLDQVEQNDGYKADVIVFLQCTSPLTEPGDIDGTVQKLVDEKADSAFAVTSFHRFIWKNDSTGSLKGVNHDWTKRQMRQQREVEYLETGAVYVMRAEGFKESRHRFFGKLVPYKVPRERSCEIDDPTDVAIANALMFRRNLEKNTENLPKKVEALVFDFDGVFTDNRAYVNELGQESVVVNRSDGYWISALRRTGLPLLVLSSETNTVVKQRCNKLELECIHGVYDKGPALKSWIEDHELKASNVVYVGNGANDLSCMKIAGCGVAVSDAEPEVAIAADIILKSSGGNGAVAEICKMIATQRKVVNNG